MSKSNQGKRKDWFIPAAIAIVAVILLVLGYFVLSPIIAKVQSEEYKTKLTQSFNSTTDENKIILSYQGEDYEINDGMASWVYSSIINYGQGYPAKEVPDASNDIIVISFPDGAHLLFSTITVDRGPRSGRDGLYIGYLNADGETYDYYTDLTDFWKFKSQLMGS